MSTDYEINQQERVQNERFRRSSFAQLVHDRARGKDGNTFTPEYDDEDPDGLDPTNLASALGEKYMNYYTRLVRIEPPQAEPTTQAPLSSMSAPRPATATGGDETTNTLQPLMCGISSRIVKKKPRAGRLCRRRIAQQYCCLYLLLSSTGTSLRARNY